MQVTLKSVLGFVLIFGNQRAWSDDQAGPALCVDAHVLKSVRKNEVTYAYRITNRCKRPLTAFWVGVIEKPSDFSYELGELPIGWDYFAAPQKIEAHAPGHWEVRVITEEESEFHAIEWSSGKGAALSPGESLGGLTVTVAKPDPQHERGHWMANFDEGSKRFGTLLR